MASRAVARRARSRVALGLLAFVAVASAVVARRAAGARRAREIVALDRQRSALASERARLVSALRNEMSLGRMLPVVSQRLQMRVPGDAQVVRVPRPAAPKRRATGGAPEGDA
jgi:membrane protein implicated in regulation of membrane protease activity